MGGGENQLEGPEKVLVQYLNGLDDDIDDNELLESLRRGICTSDTAKQSYEQAVFARTLFYFHMSASRLPRIKARLEAITRAKRQSSNESQDIWEYLNKLLDSKGATWTEILKPIGLDPHLGGQIRSGKAGVQRFAPSVMAQISHALNADPNMVFRLIYDKLLSSSNTSQSFITHFRLSPSGEQAHGRLSNFPITPEEGKSNNQMLKYMKELEIALRSPVD